MDWSVGSPRTRSVVGVCGPGVSVFGLPQTFLQYLYPGRGGRARDAHIYWNHS